MIHSENPLLHFRRRRSRNEIELVIGRSAVRIILAILTVALAGALALTGSGHAHDLIEAIRRLPPF
jgi:hypothetical protein